MVNKQKEQTKEKVLFENSIKQREENIQVLEDSIAKHEFELALGKVSLEEVEFQLAQPIKELAPLKAQAVFEENPAWIELQRKKLTIVRDQKIKPSLARLAEILIKEKEGLANEKLRLTFIKQGIPAWVDAEFENAKRKLSR